MSTVANLLADIKVRAYLSSSQQTLTDAEIVDLASKELQNVIAPKIISARDAYWETFQDYTISTNRFYLLPSRRIGGRITRVEIRDPNNSANPVQLMVKRHPEDVALYGMPSYHISGESLVINGTSITSGTLRIYFNLRPGTLSTTAATSTVSTVSGTTVTLASLAVNGTYDIVSVNSPFNVKATGVTFASGVATVSADYNVASGDAIYAVSTTGYPPLPIELHDWLAIRSSIRVARILGQRETVELLASELRDVQEDIMALITPRAEQDEKVIINKESLGFRDWK